MSIIHVLLLLGMLVAVVGLSVGIVRLFDWFVLRKKNDMNLTDNNFERIRGKWLSVLKIYAAMLVVVYGAQLFFAVKKAATHEAVVYSFSYFLMQLIIVFVIQIYLAYHFTYKQYGTKYILFVIVLLSLNLASTIMMLQAPVIWLYEIIANWHASSVELKITSIVSASYMIFFACLILFYILRSIKLYKANKQYRISTMN